MSGMSGLTTRAALTTAIFHPTACLASDGSLSGAYAIIAGGEDGSIHLLQVLFWEVKLKDEKLISKDLDGTDGGFSRKEAAADEEHRLAEEALAEEAAAEELTLDAVDADLVEEEEAWMTEDDMADEAWLLQSQELLEQLKMEMTSCKRTFSLGFYPWREEHFEDALESLEQDPYGDMGESDDDISLADFAHQPDPIPDFNDWGNDPFGADKAAALSFNLNWKKIWEVPKVPLGTAELWQFGPNGPPMNVMDTCPVSNMLWIANQQELFGFPLPTLEDPNSCNDLMEFTRISASRGQINRLRCGQLGRQPVVVAVDAAGGVLVAPTHKSKMSPMKLLNVASGRDQGVSTWGIGLSPTDEGSDAGPLLVSANDHCLKVGGFPVLQVILGWPQFNACFFGQNISDVPH
eukprot:symbB.v1.2.023790.t1/scaffold2207.1/size85781/6